MLGHNTRIRWDKETKEFRAQYSDPVQPFLDDARRSRDLEAEAGGMRKTDGYQRVGTVPMTEVLRIKEKWGIDLTALRDKAERKLAFQIIEREYPHLKTTNSRIG